MFKHTIKIAAVIVISIASVFGLSACGGSASAEATNLDGTYVYTTSGDNAIVAEVKQDTILINFKNDDNLGLYWSGTFKSLAKDGDTINSAGNVEQLQKSATGSQDSAKEFAIGDGTISFKMSMMGQSKVIELKKNSASTN